MNKRLDSPVSLWTACRRTGDLSGRVVVTPAVRASLGELIGGSVLDGRGEELRDRSVLIMTNDQFTAAMALCELDGIARRIVLYPPDLAADHLASVMESAQVDALISDRVSLGSGIPCIQSFMPSAERIVPQNSDRSAQVETEWILLTSGTAGMPKLVVHTLASLAGAMAGAAPAKGVVWSTFYDIRRYGGLQIFLRAVLTGTSFVMSSSTESTAEFLSRAAANGVTHISGTPSHWRGALMSGHIQLLRPECIRLSGEIADAGILRQLRSSFPAARVVHAFASTEAGVAFEVDDGLPGFPAGVLSGTPDVEMKIENQTLCIRSNRTARCYLGKNAAAVRDKDGFVNTGDVLALREGRYQFVGRRDGMINVGGLKVHPEEVEAVLNRHQEVQMSLVRTRKSPITGAIVVADVVLRARAENDGRDFHEIRNDILGFCRGMLPSHKVPAAINFVPALAVAESGKLIRSHA